MSGRRALVTGASGFVGANLARRLLDAGHEVSLVLRPGRDRWRLGGVLGQVRVLEADLEEREAVRGLVAEARPEWVFHLAAYGAYPEQDVLEQAVRTNLLVTMHLAQACLEAGFEGFVNAGSSSEYGFKDHAPGESEALEPNSSYAVAKASATLLLRHLAVSRGARFVTLRLYSAYGPFEEPTRLVPRLAVLGLSGRLPPLVNPDVARDFVHVDDVCDAFLAAAGEPDQEAGAVYNVGTGVQTTIREAVDVTRRVLGLDEQPQWGTMAERKWDTTTWVADSRRIRSRLGWSPRHTFESGFRATVDWFHEHPEMLALYSERVIA